MTNSLSPEERADVIAPVQGYSRGIPWEMHLRAYDAYCAKWGPQKALIDLEGRNCRGGFSVGELDVFIPGWREELTERTALLRQIADLTARAEKAEQLSERRADLLSEMVEAVTYHHDGDGRRSYALKTSFGSAYREAVAHLSTPVKEGE